MTAPENPPAVSEAAKARACALLKDADPRSFPDGKGKGNCAYWIHDAVARFIQEVSDAAKGAERTNSPQVKQTYFAPFILPNPVDPLLIEAREIVECSVHWSPQTDRDLQSGKNDSTPEVKIALAALRRGMELARESSK